MATLIERISTLRASSLPFAAPKRVSQATEASLVRDVLQLLQGYPTANLPWDHVGQRFYVRNGVHVLHLSQSSLFNILQVFSRAATSLRRVEFFIRRVMKGTTESWLRPVGQAHPTLEAFVNVVSMRLELLRTVALEKELEAVAGDAGTSVTLLSLFTDLSRVFAGAELLEHIVNVAVPEPEKLFKNKINAAELATRILSSLYEELDSFSLLQDGEEEAYQTLLLLFVGCLRPMIASLDTWLQEGILNDPAGELFFCEDKTVPIENSAFWENGYHLYSMDTKSEQDSKLYLLYKNPGIIKDSSSTPPATKRNSRLRRLSTDSNSSLNGDVLHGLICPSFLQPLAKSILSAGKSLRLLQHVRRKHVEGDEASSQVAHSSSRMPSPFLPVGFTFLIQGQGKKSSMESEATSSSDCGTSELNQDSTKVQISLYEQFCASLRALVGVSPVQSSSKENSSGVAGVDSSYLAACSQRGIPSQDDLLDVLYGKGRLDLGYSVLYKENPGSKGSAEDMTDRNTTAECLSMQKVTKLPVVETSAEVVGNQLPDGNENNNVKSSEANSDTDSESHVTQHGKWEGFLNLAQYCQLPALDDEQLRRAIFDPSNEKSDGNGDAGIALHNLAGEDICHKETGRQSKFDLKVECSKFCKATDFNYGQGFGKLLFLHDRHTLTSVESLLPYPTLLPSYLENCNISEQLPSHRQRTPSMLEWIQSTNLKATPASIVVQECLTSSIQKQVDHVGQQLLSKLMGEWRLMEEFALLRAIYLVGSGDLLQQFASVLFNKLDRGEPWDDFYELNTMLQESVRSSSHGMVLPALDSLVVTVLPRSGGNLEKGSRASASPPQIAGRAPLFGIDSLDSLFFTYKVAWPLELIVGSSAIKKYNQVMLFLLKVKRAKHALDKACRWTWKNGVGDAAVHKQRVLLQQKLMHFVNTLHQYVMDRVLYSSWVELSENVASAGSLDEVIACHDAYLVSIQRQCIVAPDKLWTLIASRVKTILGLALTYYSIQRVLCDGVGASAISARCQLEIERVERQFDECMVFLMRVLSFKLNVGHFPHLADLVTRINYNFYYMTEDGQLSTPIPETLGQVARRSSRRN